MRAIAPRIGPIGTLAFVGLEESGSANMWRMSSPAVERILDNACRFDRPLAPGMVVVVNEGWKSSPEVGSLGVGNWRWSFPYILSDPTERGMYNLD